MTTIPDQSARPAHRFGWLQALLGVAIGVGGMFLVQGVGFATAYIAAVIHPEWELDVLLPGLIAMAITAGLVLLTTVVVGIRLIRRGRRPLGIGLLVIPVLQIVALVGWGVHLATN